MSQVLSGTYHSTVNLDQGAIGKSLTVTGTIQVGYYGGAGISGGAYVFGAYILNQNFIEGGSNGGTATAGAGVYLGAIGTVDNKSTIDGGEGGNASQTSGFYGGIGVDLSSGGMLTNSGLISGGTGGNSASTTGGSGGDGFLNLLGQGTLTNTGLITGGNGGNGVASGGGGGAGVYLAGGGTMVNGNAADPGIGLILGGVGGYGFQANLAAFTDGTGVILDQGSVCTNFGDIKGGSSDPSEPWANDYGCEGGSGAFAQGMSTIINAGLIEGGIGAGYGNVGLSPVGSEGGVGVLLEYGSALINTGTIIGGNGGYSDGGGRGGNGLSIDQSAGVVSNDGTILGGNAGPGNDSGSTGAGAGVSLEGGDTFTNNGFIEGGAGGFGGNGVYLNGGTLFNAGLIDANNSLATWLGAGCAVLFGPVASTLVVDPGARFGGDVAANTSVSDALDLAGVTAVTLSGLGSQFTGFRTVTIEAGADWALGGSNTAPATETINIGGSLTIDGDLLGAGTATLATNGLLQISGSSELQLGALFLAGNKLTCPSQGTFVVGSNVNGEAGFITLDAGATVTGFGTIASKLTGSGTLAVSGGNVMVESGISGSVSAKVAAKQTLDFSGGGTFGAITGAGVLQLDGASPYALAGAPTLGIATIAIDSKVALSGHGKIAGALANAGTLTALGGTLTLAKAPTGNGAFDAATGSTLDFAAGATTSNTLSGAGTIVFAGVSTLDAGTSLQVAHVLDLKNVTLGSGVSLTNAVSHDVAIDAALGGTITLAGAAGDTFTNMGSLACTGAGTVDVKVAIVNSGSVSAGSGHLACLGALTNTGTISAGTGVLTLAAEALGSGTITIGQAGILALQEGAASAQTVQFDAASGLLDLTHPLTFEGGVSDFAGKDSIDLLNTPSTSFSFSGGMLTVENGTATVAKFDFAGIYTKADFAIGSDGHGGTVVAFV